MQCNDTDSGVDFLAATAEYPDPPNFYRRRKSTGKMTAAVNAAKFVKFSEPSQKLWLTFGWVYHFTKPRTVLLLSLSYTKYKISINTKEKQKKEKQKA